MGEKIKMANKNVGMYEYIVLNSGDDAYEILDLIYAKNYYDALKIAHKMYGSKVKIKKNYWSHDDLVMVIKSKPIRESWLFVDLFALKIMERYGVSNKKAHSLISKAADYDVTNEDDVYEVIEEHLL